MSKKKKRYFGSVAPVKISPLDDAVHKTVGLRFTSEQLHKIMPALLKAQSQIKDGGSLILTAHRSTNRMTILVSE